MTTLPEPRLSEHGECSVIRTEDSILNMTSDAVVNAVNIVGVMGSGIARLFKAAYPEMFTAYKNACFQQKLRLGVLHIYPTNTIPTHIINYPTKLHWENPSRYEYIITGFRPLARLVIAKHIKTLALPPLGCGNGGLDPTTVKNLIMSCFYPLVRDHLKTLYLCGFNTAIIHYEQNQTIPLPETPI